MQKDPYKDSQMFSFVIHSFEFEKDAKEFVELAYERSMQTFELAMKEFTKRKALHAL